MSSYGSQNRLHTIGRKTTTSRGEMNRGSYTFSRAEYSHSGNGYPGGPGEFATFNPQYSRMSVTGVQSGPPQFAIIQQKAILLQEQVQDCMQKAEMIQNTGITSRNKREAENLMNMLSDCILQLKGYAVELQQIGQSNENILRSIDVCQEQLQVLNFAMGGTVQRKKSIVVYDDPGRNFQEAMAWMGQQKRLIETSPWGDDSAAIEQQIFNQNKFHSSIQRSTEVERARDELQQKGDKVSLHMLEQEWENLQRMSITRTKQLQDLQRIIEEISREIMWVNEREEEELVFDWGDKNIDAYIPKKQESYSKLMRDLEEKEKELNKVKLKAEGLLKSNHPASDKIEAYMDTLQTQWSWLLQITKCIDVHLKENAAYSQFFKEANETNLKLQKQHEAIRQKFSCDRSTPLDNLLEMLKNLEREKERIMENKRQVQLLVNKSKSIVRLKPRNPEDKSSSQVMVQALCDFKQDQKVILKGNEGILKDNSQRSKWLVTGPGGLDMLIPSVCLLVPPPNPLSITLANKNEQYYEAILGIWNQLFINIKSLISWQYCVRDITRINSLTISMLAKMRPEEYRNIIRSLETHYQEFQRNCLGSEMFGDEDKKNIETGYTSAQAHYDKLVIQLPAYIDQEPPKVIVASKENQLKVEPAQTSKGPVDVQSQMVLTDLQSLRRRLETAELGLTQHLHLPLHDDSLQECSQRISQLEIVHRDISGIGDAYIKLKAKIQSQLQNMTDADKAKFLQAELDFINQKLRTLEGFSSSYLERLKALRALFQCMIQAEDTIKVHEARLTEKETTSLDPNQVEEYKATLKQMKADLEQKRDLFNAMESQLSNTVHWNEQISQSFHKCDVDLSKYSELVGQMSDRWHRILAQINTRTQDMEKYLPILRRYLQTSSTLSTWIDDTRQRQDNLQVAKFDDVKIVMEQLNQQKMLNSEIKAKREDVEDVQRDADTCAGSIKDYELQLASYGAGLETLLNIPVRKTLLQSPSTIVSQEAANLQTRYIELLTRSGDYHKFLGEMLKNSEELKMRNTRIDLLEEELRILRGEIQDRSVKNKSLEDAIGRYQLELSQSKDQLLTMEEVKRTQAMQCNATKEDLNSTFNQVKDLNEQVARLTYQIDEEKRMRRLAEERYTNQQAEYELVIRKRQKELEEINWAKIDIEKTIKDKEREIERLRRQLEDEMARQREIESELSKTSNMIHNSQTHYNELLQEKEGLLLKIKMLEQDKSKLQRYEDELNRIKVTLESEQRQKQRLQDENMQISRDFSYWKSQYELKEEQVRKCTSDKDATERERNSLKNEIARLMSELRMVDDRYKLRLNSTEKEIADLKLTKDSLERELRKLNQHPDVSSKQTQTSDNEIMVDSSKLLFDGIRKKVSANQLFDCGVIDKSTLNQLLKGQKTVQDVAVDIQLNLKGTSVIAGITGRPQEKMPITEAKKKNVITPEGATMLLEAQAATGHIIDPRVNEKMAVDVAYSKGLVDAEDRDTLIRAECASTGFIDPHTGKLLSVGQAMKKGQINKETALRLLQAQEAAGGIVDPVLSVFLPKDVALDRSLIDEDLYRALNKKPTCYIDPVTQEKQTYIDLKLKSRPDPSTGLLLFPALEKPLTVQGLRGEVSISELVDANLLGSVDVDGLREGRITSTDIENRLRSYLRGSTCIAGIYDEAKNRTVSFYKAMKEGLLRPGTTLELLEAQAASGFIIDPVNNQYLTVEEATQKDLVGREFKDKLLSAERAVTGYKDPLTGTIISLFQAMEKGLIEKGHGIRLLEAQIASGGIIDPKHSHRIDVDVAYKRKYFDKEMNDILSYEGDDTKGFFDPNTEENLTYLQLKKRCITDESTGLVLLPLRDKTKQYKTTQKKTLRKRRVVIVDPDTKKEMTVQEAYEKQLIDYETYVELSGQESEWEEITITGSDGSTRFVIIDRKTGIQHDIQDSLNRGIIDQATFDKYRSGSLTLTQFADTITRKTSSSQCVSPSTVQSVAAYSSPPQQTTDSTASSKHIASVSIMVSKSSEKLNEQGPIGAIFDTETLEKITITEALRRGIVDSITAQRLLEAQACTGGIINPATNKKLSLQDAARQGIIDDDMATRLKPAQKAYLGFEDVKTKRKMSAAEAMKEKWLPYEAGQRFLEFQYLTGGLVDPEFGQRSRLEDVVRKGWLDERTAQKLRDTFNHPKNLTCPKTKLKISYKEAMDNCMVEERSGLMMLQASSISSKGISSPYNVSSAPGSQGGSRSGSRSGSRRGSVDLTSKFSYSFTSFSSSALS
ncbi:desmoplakin-B isoform X2 [Scleropages formosus]|uniref:desmoplakin-B isoform X2 n=1 Tax=Scleropages formosus TaxID=113540 RepID=UPI0008783E60|nr:desmoplakin isoform X2 [Scleropages formosus]